MQHFSSVTVTQSRSYRYLAINTSDLKCLLPSIDTTNMYKAYDDLTQVWLVFHKRDLSKQIRSRSDRGVRPMDSRPSVCKANTRADKQVIEIITFIPILIISSMIP